MNTTKISKFISMILRHRPELIGIELDHQGGWANTEELIAGIRRTTAPEFDLDTLKEIVAKDKKQRYSFSDDHTKIRANQGHSIDVDMGFEPKEPPELLYHGTAERFVDSINKNGLTAQSRQYVHLSLDEQTAYNVGKRHGKPYIFKVMSGDMHRDGYEFYLSDNGVWLTKVVPPKYLEGINNGGAQDGQQTKNE